MEDERLGKLIVCYWRPPDAGKKGWRGGWYPVPPDRRGDLTVAARSADDDDRVTGVIDEGRTMGTGTYTAICVFCSRPATLHVVRVQGDERVMGATVDYYTGSSLCDDCAREQLGAFPPRANDDDGAEPRKEV